MCPEILPIHIGLHKCASTYLQHNIFPFLFKNAPLDKNTGVNHPKVTEIFWSGKVDNLSIISSEKFSGSIHPEWPGESFERFKKFCNHLSSLSKNRLPKLLLIVRNHRDYLKSAYLQKKKKAAINDFIEYLSLHSQEDLSWSARIELINKYRFPLLVVDVEDLKNHQLETILIMADYWECRTSYNEVIDLIKKPKGLENISPKNKIGLKILHCEAYLRGNCFKIFNLLTLNKFNIQWKNTKIREKLVLATNSLFTHNDIENFGIPSDWEIFFRSDWQKVKKFIQHPVTRQPVN